MITHGDPLSKEVIGTAQLEDKTVEITSVSKRDDLPNIRKITWWEDSKKHAALVLESLITLNEEE